MSRITFAVRWLAPAILSSFFLSGCLTTNQERPTALAADAAAPQAQGKLDTAYRELLLSHGRRALETEKYEEATSAYKRLLAADPQDPEAAFGMAETMLAAGDFPAALGYYRALNTNEAFRARAWQGEGLVLLSIGQPRQSGEILRKAVADDVTLWRAWNGLGRTLDIEGKHDEAKNSYDRALALEP